MELGMGYGGVTQKTRMWYVIINQHCLDLFHISVKSKFDIEEYSFGQTTLEQVFIEFAKLQEAANQDKGGGGGEQGDAEAESKKKMRLLRQHSDAQSTMAVLNGMPSNSVEVTEV